MKLFSSFFFALISLLIPFFGLASSSVASASASLFKLSQDGKGVFVGHVIDDRDGSVFDAKNKFIGFSAADGGIFDSHSDLVGFCDDSGAVTRGRESLAFVTAGGQLVDLLNNNRLLGWVDGESGTPSKKEKCGIALLFLLGKL
jgi:hypothetical protein